MLSIDGEDNLDQKFLFRKHQSNGSNALQCKTFVCSWSNSTLLSRLVGQFCFSFEEISLTEILLTVPQTRTD